MQFTVPQFIEHEPKILGPLTIKQFVFVGTTGAVCFFLYFLLPFSVFLTISIVLIFGMLVLVFLKIDGRPLLTILANALKFNLSPKMYIWKKKEELRLKNYQKERGNITLKNAENKEETSLKIAPKSQLERLRDKIEI